MAVSWRAVIALGLPFLFIPINTLCYAGIPQEKYNEVSGLTALMRNLGGSVGISFVTTLLARLSQKHLAMLVPKAAAGNPAYDQMRAGLAGAWVQRGSAMPDAIYHAGAQIYGMAQVQGRLLAYVDVIWVMVAVTAVLIPLPFVMNRPTKTPRRPHRPLKRPTASYSKPPAPHSIRHPERPTGVEGPAAAFSSLTKQSWRFSTHSFPGTIPRAVACSPSMRVLCA